MLRAALQPGCAGGESLLETFECGDGVGDAQQIEEW
jgi:hypothetical protein